MPPGNPLPGEIYLLRQPLFRRSTHPHPVLVIRVTASTATVNFMSSELSLCREGRDLVIPDNDPDFPKTGLKNSSFLVVDGGAVEVPLASLQEHWGEVPKGKLREQISDWWGEKI